MPQKLLKIAMALCFFAPASAVQAQLLTSVECSAVQERVIALLDAEYGVGVTRSPSSASAGNMQGCIITDLDIYVQPLDVVFRAEQLVFFGNGLMDWQRSDVVLPYTVDARLEGLALSPQRTPPSDLAWLAGLNAESISLSATWQEDIQRLQISPLRIDMGDQNIVSLSLDGRGAGWQPSDMPLADFSVTDLSLDVQFNGLFEQAILPPIVQNGNDMSTSSMEFLAAMADGLMANAPPSLLSTNARTAIVDFLRTLPTPRGILGLSLTNDTPISPERILFDLRTGVPFATAVPETLNIDANWVPLN